MKDSIDLPVETTTETYELCSIKKCATCFAYRGCMYEHYLIALGMTGTTMTAHTPEKDEPAKIRA